MIVTLDTGILVRATSRSQGPARRLIQSIAHDPSHVLALSPYILGEVGKVLAYSKLQQVLGISAEEIHDHVAYLRQIARIVEVETGPPVVLSDPKDDAILYTAVGAGAEVLCVRDRHFYAPNVVAFCRRFGVEVLDDIQLLARLATR
ncbi:MAG: putative toxin-antitoxin system toxin component, PIN family [Bryobacteraceae bacterium]